VCHSYMGAGYCAVFSSKASRLYSRLAKRSQRSQSATNFNVVKRSQRSQSATKLCFVHDYHKSTESGVLRLAKVVLRTSREALQDSVSCLVTAPVVRSHSQPAPCTGRRFSINPSFQSNQASFDGQTHTCLVVMPWGETL
jgi:hypothetical protein